VPTITHKPDAGRLKLVSAFRTTAAGNPLLKPSRHTSAILAVFIVTAVCCLLSARHASTGPMLLGRALAAEQYQPGAASGSERFRVGEWTLTYSFESNDPYHFEEHGTTYNRSVYRQSQSGTISLHGIRTDAGVHQYRGEGPVTCSIESVTKRSSGGETYEVQVIGNGTITAKASLDINFRNGTYHLEVHPGDMPVSRHSTLLDQFGEPRNDSTTISFKGTSLPFPSTRIEPSLPPEGMVISGTYSIGQLREDLHQGPVVRYSQIGDGGLATGKATWRLIPGDNSEAPELVVDPQGYETWRPQAGQNESTIGNEIKIDAKLQRPDGGAANVKARKIIFELSGTSHEPGVAMNFPLPSKAVKDFDLQFSPKNGSSGQLTIIGEGNQRVETVPGEYSAASAVVSSYDWGGWSTLKVTAELPDGRQITGHLKGERGTTEILLPKRAKDSKIADIWKQNTGVSLPDDDDSETGPAGASSPGDGFSLYEEYRGFYVNGRHVSGDPKKIDYFVRNYIGPDARPGIDLFADLTGAEVHEILRDAEFDRQQRVMNANHEQGPHLVDQHGVFLETKPTLDGGLTVFSKEGVRGRPVITLSVNLQPRDSLTSMVTSENVPRSDLTFAYDRAVAHELMHSVGAEHHGEGDGQATFIFVFGDDPENKTGKSHFRYPLAGSGSGIGTQHMWEEQPVKITDEVTGRDLASLMEGDMMLERERRRPDLYPELLKKAGPYVAGRQGMNTPYPWSAEQTAEHWLDANVATAFSWYIGAQHGQSSGNEICLMRYYFARMYKKQGQDDAFYFISDTGSEHAGLELCGLPVGTGVNGKDRKPQARYGDAAATRGACAASIIFNDALPLKSDAIPQEPKP